MATQPRSKKIVTAEEKEKRKVFRCRKCEKSYIALSRFYMATNTHLDTNGKMSICKECARQIYQENYRIYKEHSRALYETCYELDIVYSQQYFDATFNYSLTFIKTGRTDELDFFGFYMGRISNTTSDRQTNSGTRFKDSDTYNFDSNIEVTKSIDDAPNESKLTEYKEEWGENHDLWEFKFLENELFKIQNSFECSDYGMTMLMRDICFINLSIEKERRKGNDAQKLIESRSKLMADAKMKPVQSTGIEANDAITFGTLIKKYENERPIPVYMDDEMRAYIDTYMVGQLAKMEGLNNEFVDKMEKDLSQYSVDFSSMDVNSEEDLED